MMIGERQIDEIKEVVAESCKIARDYYYGSSYKVEIKEDNSPVTDADKAISNLLSSRLQQIIPGVVVISEEGDNLGDIKKVESFWLVDPIDGTKGFIYKDGNFTINVALIHKGVPIFGIIAEPLLNEIYYTNEDREAIFICNDIKSKINVNRVDSGGVNVLLSQRHRSKKSEDVVKKLPTASVKHISSSYKFCMVADGRADLYLHFGETCTWDIAAGHAILKAAGGMILNMEGDEMVYSSDEFDNLPFHAMNDIAYSVLKQLSKVYYE